MGYRKINKDACLKIEDKLFAPTDGFEVWKENTEPKLQLLSLIYGAIDGDIATDFMFDEALGEPLENVFYEAIEHEQSGIDASWSRSEIANMIKELIKEDYVLQR
jgi:hypothetical protein